MPRMVSDPERSSQAVTRHEMRLDIRVFPIAAQLTPKLPNPADSLIRLIELPLARIVVVVALVFGPAEGERSKSVDGDRRRADQEKRVFESEAADGQQREQKWGV